MVKQMSSWNREVSPLKGIIHRKGSLKSESCIHSTGYDDKTNTKQRKHCRELRRWKWKLYRRRKQLYMMKSTIGKTQNIENIIELRANIKKVKIKKMKNLLSGRAVPTHPGPVLRTSRKSGRTPVGSEANLFTHPWQSGHIPNVESTEYISIVSVGE